MVMCSLVLPLKELGVLLILLASYVNGIDNKSSCQHTQEKERQTSGQSELLPDCLRVKIISMPFNFIFL